MTTLDPVTLAVIESGLQQVCNEMDLAFVRSAFSPVISEALDRSDGIYARDTGDLIAQGDLGLPVFVGTMQFSTQAVIFKRKHNWLMCWLYTGTFGSFIGFSAGLPLLAKSQFPDVNVLQYVFLGPLVGAVSRAATGWVSDKWGGARVTFWVFVAMMIGVLGVMHFLEQANFVGFLGMFIFLFFVTGVGNASTFQMIPVIMRQEVPRLMPQLSGAERTRQAEKESAAIVGFTSAIAAYGAFFIPKSFGSSIAATGSPMAALAGFLVFYASCAALTWFVYTRKGGVLHDIERGKVAQLTPALAQ